MRKLKLETTELKVESFSVLPAAGSNGTVHGNIGDPNHPDVPSPSFEGCTPGGGAVTVGTCIGPTYCCPPTWKQTCADTCLNTQCGGTCITWYCNTCHTCMETCQESPTCNWPGCGPA